jgi:hypothetical protein
MTTKEQDKLNLFIHKVQNRSGNALASVIKQYANDIDIQLFLKYTYDTFHRVYYVTPTADYIFNPTGEKVNLYAELDKLSTREVTGNKAQVIVDKLLAEFGIIAYSILNRKIPGTYIGPVTINKAIPGLIYIFKVQKAKDIDYKYVKYPVYVECKYDGNFIQIMNGRFHTRSGLAFDLPGIIVPKDIVVIAEAIIGQGKLGDRPAIQGRITKARKDNLSRTDVAGIRFVCFDSLTPTEVLEGVVSRPYNDRLTQLYKDIHRLNSANIDTYAGTMFTPVESIICNSTAEVKKHIIRLNREGYEGVVLKDPNHLYEFKRSRAWMRCKVANSVDLKCIGYAWASDGKYKGQLKHLVCAGKVEGTYVEVHVGQGFSDIDRKKGPDYYIGYTIELTYNEVSVNNRLNIPVFIGRREKWDK